MPLTPTSSTRTRLHARHVRYEGYERDDGLFDIEAHLTDAKDYDCVLRSGVRRAGEPVHDMWIRVTMDRNFTVRDIEASTDAMPYPGACNQITPSYRQLIGLNLVSGFRKALHRALGGVKGCTHLTELLGYLPTAAMQTIAGFRPEDEEIGGEKPFQLDKCHALNTTSQTVHAYYPKWYRGSEERAQPLAGVGLPPDE